MRSSPIVLVALALACGSSSETDGDGTGGGDDDGSPTSAETTLLPPMCPGCAGVCFEDGCLGPPEPLMIVDPEAHDVSRTAVGIAYLLSETGGGADAIYEQPLGGAPTLLVEAPPEQFITAVWFDGDRVWMGARYPDSLYVFDRTTSEVTLVRDLDTLLIDLLGIADGAIFGRTYDGVSRIALDGSTEQLITRRDDGVVLADGAIYMLEGTSTNVGEVVVYDLMGTNRRVLGTWAGFPTRIDVSGAQVVWYGEPFQDVGDGILRTVVDDGVTVSPPPTIVCPADATDFMLLGTSVVFWSWPGAELFTCPIAGGDITKIWDDPSLYDVAYTVRGDPSLVAIEDHDDVVTLHRIAWPGL